MIAKTGVFYVLLFCTLLVVSNALCGFTKLKRSCINHNLKKAHLEKMTMDTSTEYKEMNRSDFGVQGSVQSISSEYPVYLSVDTSATSGGTTGMGTNIVKVKAVGREYREFNLHGDLIYYRTMHPFGSSFDSFFYDKYNRIARSVHFSSDSVDGGHTFWQRCLYNYDIKYMEKDYFFYDNLDPGRKEIYRYDETRRIVNRTWLEPVVREKPLVRFQNAEIMNFVYNDSGRLIERTDSIFYLRSVKCPIVQVHRFKYNQFRELIESKCEVADDSDGFPRLEKFKYDSNGFCVGYYSLDSKDKVKYRATFKYDEYGNVIATDEYSNVDGSDYLGYRYEYEYDNYGNVTSEKSFGIVNGRNEIFDEITHIYVYFR